MRRWFLAAGLLFASPAHGGATGFHISQGVGFGGLALGAAGVGTSLYGMLMLGPTWMKADEPLTEREFRRGRVVYYTGCGMTMASPFLTSIGAFAATRHLRALGVRPREEPLVMALFATGIYAVGTGMWLSAPGQGGKVEGTRAILHVSGLTAVGFGALQLGENGGAFDRVIFRASPSGVSLSGSW